ncbi:MAG: hypothetical protein JWQ02_1820 [Capsulimonas sp.]|nr:hypothetical protein [Capsulimonas sp.]
MNSRPLLIGSVIGIFVLAAGATVFVGVRLVSRVVSGMGFGGFGGGGYYGINNTANRYASQGDYISAIAEYDKMVAMRPNKQDGYLLRAMAEFRARQFKRAIRDNTTALNLLKTRAGIEELGFNPNASYQTKLRMVPICQASLYYNRAVVYDNLNDLPRAIADYSADLAIRPDESDARHYRALAYLGTKQYALGIADCSYNIGRHPRRPANYFTRAQIYAAKGDSTHAEADFNQAIALKPDEMEYITELSQLLEKTQQTAKNEALWQGVVDRMPGNGMAVGGLGWT